MLVIVPKDPTLWATAEAWGRAPFTRPIIASHDVLRTGTTGDQGEAVAKLREYVLRRNAKDVDARRIRRLSHRCRRGIRHVLAFFDRPGTSHGPTKAVDDRLEHLRSSALGFRNLTNDIARSQLEAGGFRPHLHP